MKKGSRTKYNIAVMLILLVSITNTCLGQEEKHHERFVVANKEYHSHKTSFPPKAILVQLRSEQRRVQYFLSSRQFYEARQIKKDASIVSKVMKNDFEDHFTFCPVYYFMDTNAHLVKKQHFEGTLFTAEGLPISHCVIHPGDTNYYIVYYGYPEEQMQVDATTNMDFNIGNGEVMGKGLIFLNYNYRQKDFYYRFGYFDLFHKLNPRYEYRSAKYDIDYFPFAAEYQQDLDEAFNGIIVNKRLPRY